MKKYFLTNINIEVVSQEVTEFLEHCKVDRKDVIRIKLAVEEIMLSYQEQFGTEQSVLLDLRKRFGRPRIELRFPAYKAYMFNPLAQMTNEQDDIIGNSFILNNILVNNGFIPTYQYNNGCNIIVFNTKPKPPSQMAMLAISIISAILCGFAGLLLPDAWRLAVAKQFIEPIFTSFMGMLSGISGPMIFFSVAWGIYSIGDTATLGKIGKRMITRILLISFLVTIISTLAILPFFPLATDGNASFEFAPMFKMVLGMIPNNFVAPFITGNLLQIIFLAVCIALATLVLGNKTTAAATLMEQSNYIVQLMMETISKFVPYFVFGSILSMIISDNFSALLKAYKVLPITLLGLFVPLLFYTILVSVHQKLSPMLLLKKLFPTFIITVSTSSSAAAFSTNVETCENKLGIDKRIVNFGVPLGQIVFMLGTSMHMMCAVLCMAEIYNVAISPVWLLTALITCVMLSIAAPPIPGGALTCYTLLFLQCNIPPEAIPIIIAINSITEFFATATNIFCLQTELVELASDLKMLDYKKLYRK